MSHNVVPVWCHLSAASAGTLCENRFRNMRNESKIYLNRFSYHPVEDKLLSLNALKKYKNTLKSNILFCFSIYILHSHGSIVPPFQYCFKTFVCTCLVTRPSPFLSMFLKSFSMGDSSPMNSSKLNRPSKSRSILSKNSSTSSLSRPERDSS